MGCPGTGGGGGVDTLDLPGGGPRLYVERWGERPMEGHADHWETPFFEQVFQLAGAPLPDPDPEDEWEPDELWREHVDWGDQASGGPRPRVPPRPRAAQVEGLRRWPS